MIDNLIKKAMILHYHINNDFYKAKSINNNFNQLVIYHFCELFHNDNN